MEYNICCANQCYLNKEIYRCCSNNSNHYICGNCKDKVNKCPICRNTDFKRDIEMELEIKKNLTKCENKYCDYMIVPNDTTHYETCKFRQITCPECKKQCVYDDLVEHLRKDFEDEGVYNVFLFVNSIERSTFGDGSGLYIIHNQNFKDRTFLIIVGETVKFLYIDNNVNYLPKCEVYFYNKQENKEFVIEVETTNTESENINYKCMSIVEFILMCENIQIQAFEPDKYKIGQRCMVIKNNNVYRGIVLDHFYNPESILVEYEIRDLTFSLFIVEQFDINSNLISNEDGYTSFEYRTIMGVLNEEEQIEFLQNNNQLQ